MAIAWDGDDLLDQERGDNPVLPGGRIKRPWASKEEVPKTVWEGHRWSYPHHTDDEYLEALNESYHHTWRRLEEEKKMDKIRKSVGCGSPTVPCANADCNKQVPREERLCEWCQDKIRHLGSLPQGGGWEIRYTGGDQ